MKFAIKVRIVYFGFHFPGKRFDQQFLVSLPDMQSVSALYTDQPKTAAIL